MEKQKTFLDKFKEKPLGDRIALIVVVGAILAAITYGLIKDYNVSKYQSKTMGKIVDFKHISKSRYSITYKYEVQGKKYEGQVGVRYFDCYNNKECIGYEVDVFYSSKNPKFSQVYLNRFEKFKTTVYLIK